MPGRQGGPEIRGWHKAVLDEVYRVWNGNEHWQFQMKKEGRYRNVCYLGTIIYLCMHIIGLWVIVKGIYRITLQPLWRYLMGPILSFLWYKIFWPILAFVFNLLEICFSWSIGKTLPSGVLLLCLAMLSLLIHPISRYYVSWILLVVLTVAIGLASLYGIILGIGKLLEVVYNYFSDDIVPYIGDEDHTKEKTIFWASLAGAIMVLLIPLAFWYWTALFVYFCLLGLALLCLFLGIIINRLYLCPTSIGEKVALGLGTLLMFGPLLIGTYYFLMNLIFSRDLEFWIIAFNWFVGILIFFWLAPFILYPLIGKLLIPWILGIIRNLGEAVKQGRVSKKRVRQEKKENLEPSESDMDHYNKYNYTVSSGWMISLSLILAVYVVYVSLTSNGSGAVNYWMLGGLVLFIAVCVTIAVIDYKRIKSGKSIMMSAFANRIVQNLIDTGEAANEMIKSKDMCSIIDLNFMNNPWILVYSEVGDAFNPHHYEKCILAELPKFDEVDIKSITGMSYVGEAISDDKLMLIVVYGHGEFLKRCIESIRIQGFEGSVFSVHPLAHERGLKVEGSKAIKSWNHLEEEFEKIFG